MRSQRCPCRRFSDKTSANWLAGAGDRRTIAIVNVPVWDDRDWQPLPRLEGTVRADVCVVGLGGSGLAALDELAALGVSAVGVDARSAGAGAAGRNGGFVLAGLAKFFHETVAQYGRDTAAGIYRLTAEEIQRQAWELPEIIRVTGSLRLAADEKELADCRKHLAALRECGFAAEPYAGPEGEGILLPTDGVMQPLRRVRALARKLRARQVLLYENSPVRKMVPGSVVTDGGTVLCGTVIVAVDGKLEAIFPELRARVRTARLQMLATAPAPEVSLARPGYWRYGYEYWQQQPDGRVALGGFRDHALETEWTHDAEPTEFILSEQKAARECLAAGEQRVALHLERTGGLPATSGDVPADRARQRRGAALDRAVTRGLAVSEAELRIERHEPVHRRKRVHGLGLTHALGPEPDEIDVGMAGQHGAHG